MRSRSLIRTFHTSRPSCSRAIEDSYNAFITQVPHSQPQDPSGPLSGLTAAVKDMFCTTDAPTTCASRMLKDFQAPYDATVVSLLRQSGAKLVGKTNMDEFGMGSENKHSHFGPVRNPSNPSAPEDERVAGGSSGGSAAAVAAGICDVALASDTGGSTRLPAAYCGILGLKPSYGLLSRYGMVTYASSLDCVGLMSRQIDHLEALFDVLNVYDPRDPTSIPTHYRSKSSREGPDDLQGLRVGIPVEFLPEELEGRVLENFRTAVKHLKAAGATVVPVSLPSTPHCLSTYYVLSSAEASSNLARYSGQIYGHRSGSDAVLSRSEGFGPEVQKRILLGNFALNADAFGNYFLAAQQLRQKIRADFNAVFKQNEALGQAKREAPEGHVAREGHRVDCLIHPGAITPAPTMTASRSQTNHLREYAQDVLNVPSSLAGVPALNVPWGLDDQGWPLSVQLAAPWGHESVLFHCAKILMP